MASSSLLFSLGNDQIEESLRNEVAITKYLFSSDAEENLSFFIKQVISYIDSEQSNKSTIEKLLGIFYIVRPKKRSLLEQIEQLLAAYQVNHHSMLFVFKREYYNSLPFLFSFDHSPFQILTLIETDSIAELKSKVPIPLPRYFFRTPVTATSTT